jgi:hypothetical protein
MAWITKWKRPLNTSQQLQQRHMIHSKSILESGHQHTPTKQAHPEQWRDQWQLAFQTVQVKQRGMCDDWLPDSTATDSITLIQGHLALRANCGYKYNRLSCYSLHQTLMMEDETVSETLDINSILTWLIAQDNFIAFSHHESFKSYLITNANEKSSIIYKKNLQCKTFIQMYIPAREWFLTQQ